jgi:hypothetical protein
MRTLTLDARLDARLDCARVSIALDCGRSGVGRAVSAAGEGRRGYSTTNAALMTGRSRSTHECNAMSAE